MAILSLTDNPQGPQLANFVISGVVTKSAFMTVSQEVHLTDAGVLIPRVGTGDAEWVDEGGAKPVINPTLENLQVNAKKMAKIALVTREFAQNYAYVWKMIQTQAVSDLARTFDRTIAGFITAPAGFTTLKNAPVKTVTDRKSFVKAVASIGGRPTSAIVLNDVLLSELQALSNVADMPILNITDTKINGTPYVVADLREDEPIGFVGPFATDAFWGIVPGSVSIELSSEAGVEVEGTQINLWQKNLVACLVEARFGFRTTDDFEDTTKPTFRKLAVAVEEEEEEPEVPVDPEVEG